MVIDFDKLFEQFLMDKLNTDLKGKPADEVERMIPDLYKEWQNKSIAEYGYSPKDYFEKLKAENKCGEYIKACIDNSLDISDMILDFISESDVDLLIEILDNENYAGYAASIIKETGTHKADEKLIDIVNTSEDENLVELAVEILSDNHEEIVEKLLNTISDKDVKIQERYIDILYNYKGREEILDWLIVMLNRNIDTILYASYIGSYGMEEAVDELIDYLKKNDTDKYEFAEIRNAVERLGGEIPEELAKETL